MPDMDMNIEKRARELVEGHDCPDGMIEACDVEEMLTAFAREIAAECARVAEGFTRFPDAPDYADGPKLIATAIRSAAGIEEE